MAPFAVGQGTDRDIIVVVMGPTGAGMSTFVDAASRQDGKNVGLRLKSCTSEVRAVRCTRIDPETGIAHKIVLLDTPGFDDTYSQFSPMEVLSSVAKWLSEAYGDERTLSGILYFQRITDLRTGASPLRNVFFSKTSSRMFDKLLGDIEDLRRIILTTTMWGNLRDRSSGVDREQELTAKWWNFMTNRGSNIRRFDPSIHGSLDARSSAEVCDTIAAAMSSCRRRGRSTAAIVFRNERRCHTLRCTGERSPSRAEVDFSFEGTGGEARMIP